LAILTEKIEEFLRIFNDSQEMFLNIQQFYQNSSNKKISELARDILSNLNGITPKKQIIKNETNQTNISVRNSLINYV
jgi:hypothetical protein